MAAKTMVNPSYGVEGQYRLLTAFVNGVSNGDYVDTGLTNVYSVLLTARGKTTCSMGAMWVSSGGSGRVTFCPSPNPSEAIDMSMMVIGN